MKIRVAIIGTVGVPANYGGYETMVDNMLDYTPNAIEYTVYCSKPAYKEKLKEYKGAKLKYFPFKANGKQVVLYDALCTLHAWFHSDVLLCLGNTATFLYPILKLFKKQFTIHNYDGSETTRKKWNSITQWIMTGMRKCTAKYSSIHIADNEAISTLLKTQFNINPIVIEYGGDNVFPVNDDNRLREVYGLEPHEYYFNVARIEPENNIHLMLEAFSTMPEKTLALVGNWHKNSYGEDLLKRYEKYANIKMLNPIYEPKEINLLRSNCKLYIHPHSVGGTNPSLVEAMNFGLPIVAFDVIFNRVTTEEKALYFKDASSLKEIVQSKEGVFHTIALDMKEIAERRYRWKIISDKYCDLYKKKYE